MYCALVEYKGAFDAPNLTTLGSVLKLFLPPKNGATGNVYFDAKALVSVDNVCGAQFNLEHGVRQGWPASPSFFHSDLFIY